MGHDRYAMTLADTPAELVGILRVGVPVGLFQNRTEAGYLLEDGTALLETEKDENGFYLGGAGMDGMYLKISARYEPVRDEDGRVTAFRRISPFAPRFTDEEQKLISQYALNTQENLLSDLETAMRVIKEPRLRALFTSTRDKLAQVPPDACTQLMADLRFTYQSRHQQDLRQRAQATKRSKRQNKRRSDMER